MEEGRSQPVKNLISCCRHISCIKCVDSNILLLKKKSECLYDLKDAIEEDIVKELMQGNFPTRECQIWLRRAREIECHVTDILISYKDTYNIFSFSYMKIHARLRNVLSEVTCHLDKSPCGRNTIACALQGVRKEMTRLRPEGGADGLLKTWKSSNSQSSQSKSSFRATRFSSVEGKRRGRESNTESGMSSLKGKEVLEDELYEHSLALSCSLPLVELFNQGSASGGSQLMPLEEAETYSAVGRKDDIQYATSVEFEATAEPETESPPRRETIPISKSEIELIQSEREESISSQRTEFAGTNFDEKEDIPFVYAEESHSETERSICSQGTEIVGSIFEEKEGISTEREKEIEAIPFQKEDGNIMPTSTDIECDLPVAIKTSRNSGTSRMESMTLPFLRKNHMINKAEIGDSLEKEAHLLPAPMLNARTAIECNVSKILEYMSDSTTRRIGVFGIGGIGKTSALKALMTRGETKGLYDRIIWVTVSRYWSMQKIQNQVIKKLSLQVEDSKNDSLVAEKLYQELNAQKFLLILDDVWEQIDLSLVGISNSSLEDGSRVILGTRSLDICHIMAMDKVIEVTAISNEEACKLLYDQVGGIFYNPEILHVAEAIVEACSGLPLLIIVIGRTLRNEAGVSVWKHALEEVMLPNTNGVYGTKAVLQQLKFSYERLGSYDIKNCFLYSALFPDNQEVDISDLVECFIHDELIAGNWDDAYKRGHHIIDVLVGASLLQSSECGRYVNMHDMIRDTASAILSSDAEQGVFFMTSYLRNLGDKLSFGLLEGNNLSNPESGLLLLRAGAGVTKTPKEECEQAKMIFLMDNELSNLPDTPSCPQLLGLFLQRNYCLRVIPVSFFDLMPSLMILNLSKTRIKSMPQSLSKLLNLRVLVLRDCERLDMIPSEIGCLSYLEVLDLRGTEINRLPNEISRLASLRYLEVSFYGSSNEGEYFKLPHELVSCGTISGLCGLETLSFDVYPGDRRWNKNVKSIIDEIGKLEKLFNLGFYFPEVKHLEFFLSTRAWTDQSLTEFKIVVGHDFKRLVSRVPGFLQCVSSEQDRCLRFVNGDGIPGAVLEVLARTTVFYLDHHLNIRSLSEFGINVMNGLKLCIVRECPKIEMIIENEELTSVCPYLEHLSVHYLWNLTRIWKGIIPRGSFSRLRILLVHTCPKLKFIFTSSMLQFVSKLEELVVEDCQDIEEIILEDARVDSTSPTLFSLKKLTLHHLPRLVNVWRGVWPLLESISFYNCPNVKNIGMDSRLRHSIKEIKAEKEWWEELEWEETSLFLHLKPHFIPVCDNNV